MPPPSNPSAVPTYISAHSADVILSDIRPIKLKMDALMAINSFLDEFLHCILQAANSYTTDKLRDGLLKVLPTSIGKELLLEAEVELRAYWQRTGPTPATAKNDDDFCLPLAFELLRLKCGAYSTLNDTVQDVDSEARITDRVSQNSEKIPPPALVAPAALYLTAVLEAMCEHLLSNVGRVAARDSSRVYATGQDLFVALCEDDAMYGTFKNMRVYEQIESMSATPKSRRSKSLSRSNRTASQTDLRDSAPSPRQRLSSESGSLGPAAPGSRNSSDKSRAKKLFGSNRTSNEGTHQRTDSLGGDEGRQAGETSFDGDSFEDPAVLQEFDNLMRSESTMKVSLTPDRLKTMESFKQEKGPRGKSKGPITPLRLKNETNGVSAPASNSRHVPRKPSLRHVDSILEDEEEPSPQITQSLRKKSSSPSVPRSTTSPSSYNSGRLRTTSLSTQTTSLNPSRLASNGRSIPHGSDATNGIPKTRRIQKNRESLDLDDVMAGSDDDMEEASPSSLPKSPQAAARSNGNQANVSASTRELLDFLNEGPPETMPVVSGPNRDLLDFLSQGPPDLPEPMQSPEPKKGSGRLQRMMSKLSISSSDKARGADDLQKQSSMRAQSSFKSPLSRVRSKSSTGNLSSFVPATKPIPPRPRPISVTPSPSLHSTDLPDVIAPPISATPSGSTPSGSTRSRIQPASRKAVPIEDKPESPLPVPVKKRTSSSPRAVNGDTRDRNEGEKSLGSVVPLDAFPAPPTGRPTRATHPTVETDIPFTARTAASQYTNGAMPSVPASTLIDIRRLLSRATNADECRVIFDMFMAKSGIPLTSALEHEMTTDTKNPYPSPCSSEHPHINVDRIIENSIVETLLGGESEPVSLPHAPISSSSLKGKESTSVAAQGPRDMDSSEQVPLDGSSASDDSSRSIPVPSGLTNGRAPVRPIRRKQSRPDRLAERQPQNTLTEVTT